MPSTTLPLKPVAVLDTNVVLDWLMFNDPDAQALGRAIQLGTVSWLATTGIVSEHRRIFDGALAERWPTGAPDLLSRACASWAQIDPQPPGFCGLRCSDPDDQVFIDLAVLRRATWLVTRDKALLKLRRRAQGFGVMVLRPVEWAPL